MLPSMQVSRCVPCACASAVRGERKWRCEKIWDTHPVNHDGAVVLQLLEQLRGLHDHRLVRVVRGVVCVEVVDRCVPELRAVVRWAACQLGSGSYLAAKAGRLSAWT